MTRAGFLTALLLASAAAVSAQTIDGPPPPAPGESINRTADGHATVRAFKLTEPLAFDGRLDDPIYKNTKPLTGFTQTIPDTGKPATQETEAWIFFDRRYIYVACRCHDTRPESEWTANEMRRDQLGQQDNFGLMLDTFHDRRNGFMFYTNALGAQADVYVTNEGSLNNADFNPVWEVKTGRFEGGWTVEMRIPFTSLRYRPGASQVWGVQFRRTIRARNEWAWLTPLPASIGINGLTRISTAATLVGIDVPSGSKNLEIKPYAISTLTTDRVAVPAVSQKVTPEAGLDLKYGLTQNLTADFTYNTDVAAAEADDQQVNLTRFNLSLPEKRDFFLEGRGIFEFGAGGPSLFYSRQIGLNRGRTVPILAGGRLTGKVGHTSIGLLDIETGEESVTRAVDTNFTVARVKQDILRRSSVGAIFTNRSQSLFKPGESSPAYGVDGAFGFYENLTFGASYARADAPTRTKKNDYALNFGYSPDTWGLSASHLYVDKGFSPEVGFVNRDDVRQTSLTARLSPRPEHVAHVERFNWTSSLLYTPDTAGTVISKNVTSKFSTELENSDIVTVGGARDFDRLLAPFAIAPGITIPKGGYDFNTISVSYDRSPSRAVSGSFGFDYGGYYGGHDSTVSYSGRIAVTTAFSLQPSVNIHWIRLPSGDFTSQLWRSRLIYTFTPEMFVSGLVQYNTSSHTVGLNFRLRWEYSKGSEFFFVYNENQNADPPNGAFSALLDRSIAVKINRLLRF